MYKKFNGISSKPSIVYKNVFLYRLILWILYRGKYKNRFAAVIDSISSEDQAVTELCFGDIYIADWCKQTGRRWVGYDINSSFIDFAVNRGHDARFANLDSVEDLSVSNVCVIIGSLYHFSNQLERLISLMLKYSPRIIISEPVINLSNRGGIIGALARRSANAGYGNAPYRYNKQSLIASMDDLSNKLGFSYRVAIELERDIILVIERV